MAGGNTADSSRSGRQVFFVDMLFLVHIIDQFHEMHCNLTAPIYQENNGVTSSRAVAQTLTISCTKFAPLIYC